MEGQDNSSPRYIKAEVEVRTETKAKEIIKIGIGQTTDQIVEIEDSSGKTEVDIYLSRVIEEVVFQIIPEDTVDKLVEESIGIIVIEMMATIKAGIGPEKDHFQEIMAVTELEVQTIVDQGQDSELVPIGIG